MATKRTPKSKTTKKRPARKSPAKKRAAKKAPAKRRAPAKKPTKELGPRKSKDEQIAAVHRVIKGETRTVVAKDLGVSNLTVGNWYRKLEGQVRAAMAEQDKIPEKPVEAPEPEQDLGLGSVLSETPRKAEPLLVDVEPQSFVPVRLAQLSDEEIKTLEEAAAILASLKDRLMTLRRG